MLHLWTTTIHSFIHTISVAPLQVHYAYYSESLPTQHGYCVGISLRSAKNLPNVPTWRLERDCGSRTHDPSDERRRLYQCATHAHMDAFMAGVVKKSSYVFRFFRF